MAPAGPSFLEQAVPFLVIFAVFYFLIIRPQMRRQKDSQNFLSQLKLGDYVVTTSGVLGRIEGLTEGFVTLEIAEGVKIRILRSHIAGSQKEQIAAAPSKKKAETRA